MSKSFGLGRGLGSLIPQNSRTSDGDAKLSDKERVFWVSPSDIEPNPFQPRRDFEEGELNDLMESIRENGILQPITVTRLMDGKYQLIAGERRLRSAEKLKMNKIPVIVREANNQDKLILALIENIQRTNLNLIEEAKAYKKLATEFGFSLKEVAEKTGKSASTISSSIRLLNLPQELQDRISRGEISQHEARFLLSLPTQEKRLEFYHTRMDNGSKPFTAKELEVEIKKFGGAKSKFSKEPQTKIFEERLREHFDTKVEIVDKGTNKKIIIHFYDEDELPNLIKKILDKEE